MEQSQDDTGMELSGGLSLTVKLDEVVSSEAVQMQCETRHT